MKIIIINLHLNNIEIYYFTKNKLQTKTKFLFIQKYNKKIQYFSSLNKTNISII